MHDNLHGRRRFRIDQIPVHRLHLEIVGAGRQVLVLDAAFAEEHALEVQLPFLQRTLGEFTLVPLIVGDAGAADVERVIEALHDDETLIVVSSDLSHYLDYDTARAQDAATCRRIEHFDTAIAHDDACGATPLRVLLLAAKRRGMQVTTLDLKSSGDTAGARDFVVGYGAWMFA